VIGYKLESRGYVSDRGVWDLFFFISRRGSVQILNIRGRCTVKLRTLIHLLLGSGIIIFTVRKELLRRVGLLAPSGFPGLLSKPTIINCMEASIERNPQKGSIMTTIINCIFHIRAVRVRAHSCSGMVRICALTDMAY
jgi:hypothetical protein